MSPSEALHPLIFEPLYRQYLWGGRRLVDVLGRSAPAEGPLAESWEIVDRADAQSVVACGPLRGRSLGELRRDRPAELLGRRVPFDASRADGFPLLVKILDAALDLSVQVHPDDACASRLTPPDRGKSEAWYVVDSHPGSLLHLGLRPGTDRETLRRSIAAGSVEDVLATRASRSGDCFYLPAGTVHSLGAGNLVVEVQQSSDVTYRLHDWNRLGPDGRPRPLHVEAGMAAVRSFEPVVPTGRRRTTDPDAVRLVDCEHFILEEVRPGSQWTTGSGFTAEILVCISGGFAMEGRWSLPPIVPGGTVLLPAAIGPQVLTCHGDTLILRVSLPTSPATTR